ncbi:multidrug efflux SMR transporter [Bacillus gobiensis]|uniref:DMT family transporter n=1 Tax=Bacillus gobiensis TaxID=1441095 RepID=UPI003D1DD9FC
MAWIALFSAGFCEVFGVFAIKRVTVYQNWTSYLFLVLAYGLSFSLLSLAMTGISMGTAYAVWTGIGTAGSMLLGMIAFGERKEWKRIFFISLILVSAVGLRLIS